MSTRRIRGMELKPRLGFETMPRRDANSIAVSSISGALRYAMFWGDRTETVTQAKVFTGGTAAAATPSLCKIGLMRLAPNGDGTYNATLIASTANDTSLFATINTAYTRAFAASAEVAAGRLYAIVTLVVTAAAAPTFIGYNGGPLPIAEYILDEPLFGYQTGVADLPATVASVPGGAGSGIYGVVLP